MVYDNGFIGDGKYNSHNHRHIYNVWHNILQRCYDDKPIKKYMAYKDCFLCDEWLNFQNFAKWYEDNIYYINNERMCLDKDILIKNNKIYSPGRCCFVPNHINMLFTKVNKSRGKYPIGVYYDDKINKYIAKCKSNGKSIYLGSYDTVDEAFYHYKEFKEKEILKVTLSYKEWLPINVFNALINYKVDIND